VSYSAHSRARITQMAPRGLGSCLKLCEVETETPIPPKEGRGASAYSFIYSNELAARATS